LPVSLATPVTLGTSYADNGTLGPFQEIDELVFQNTGGPLIFQFGTIDPTGAVHFDNQEVIYPPGTWAFRNLQGIRFRSNQGSASATLQSVTAFFKDDPEPFTPGNVPGSVSLTSTLNFQHNDIFVASEPTLDFEDQSNSDITWIISDDNANSRMKATPVFVGGAKYADKTTATAQVFTGDVVAGGATLAVGSAAGSLLHFSGTVLAAVASTAGAVFESTVTGDTTAFRFLIDGTGTMKWSTGALAADTQAGRLAANVWGTASDAISTAPLNNGRSTTGVFLDPAGRTLNTVAAVTNATFGAAVVGDSAWRISADLNIGGSNAGFVFGDGTAVGDTTLFRGTTAAPSGTSIGLQTGSRVTCTSTTGFNTNSGVNNTCLAAWLSTTDTQPAFKIFQQGAMIWGPGGSSATDIELARVVNAPTGTGSFLEIINGDGFGFGTGTGHSVTQLTSKTTTTPASNFPTGKVTLAASTLNAGQQADFTVPCSVYGVEDTVIVTQVSNSGISSYLIWPIADGIGPTAGNMRFCIQNVGTLSEGAVVSFQYAIIKGAIS
jgi:hypothetical protein